MVDKGKVLLTYVGVMLGAAHNMVRLLEKSNNPVFKYHEFAATISEPGVQGDLRVVIC
jgi:hypothetical protein